MRNLIYLSYAKKYDGFRRQFRECLTNDGRIEFWDDLKIPKGADWRSEIETHVPRARVMVMFVGPEYLHPECGAAEYEIPQAIAAARDKELLLLWLPTSDPAACHEQYPEHPIWEFNAALPEQHPIDRMDEHERLAAWRAVHGMAVKALGFKKRKLIVMVPGHLGKPSTLDPLKKFLESQQTFDGCEWQDFAYSEPLLSNRDPEEIARELGATIQARFDAGPAPVNEIILAGHSMGTTLLRRAYLNARGTGSPPRRQPWADAVTRIVLMGAIGRGFDLRRLKLHERPIVWLAKLLRVGKMRRAILKGADYVTRLRLDWIRFNVTTERQPTLVHLLGTGDSRVLAEDVIDIEQFPNVVPVEIPGANHASVVQPEAASQHLLVRAFMGDSSSDRKVEPSGADSIVFLLHGIRDSKECFDCVREGLRGAAKSFGKSKLEVVQPQYRRMSAPAFVSPWRRRAHIPWFVDEYSECLAHNPNATFYFAGHSNGTYILGESLRRMPGMKFERVYVGGSVLPPDYPWRDILNGDQVHDVRSDRGSEDWPVGILARALNKLGMKDIGSGGYDRFSFGGAQLAENLFKGDHSAMLEGDEQVKSIVSYLVHGEPRQAGASTDVRPPRWFSFAHKYGDLVLPVALVLLLVAIGVGSWWIATALLGWHGLTAVPLALIVVTAIWLFMERF